MKGKIDYSESLRVLRRDKSIRALIDQYGRPELSRYFGGIGIFPALLRSIVYQQLSGYAAAAIHRRVLLLFPSGKPTPKQVLKIRSTQLHTAGLSIQKITYVRDLAKKCIDGTIREKDFPHMSSEEIIEHLVCVKGVGVWTAHMVLIFLLHRLDILPVGDLAIRKGFQKIYRLKKPPHATDMERIARPWRAHASVASWYLWRAMDEARKPIRR
ncbi:DNA-3-methyladenine glycosylase 2 family protein [Candidatus Kaiserbacteria bacterium]|nr:DNA-3-methyladenine glycosylase 2 family protein [Candidatus Kaiserbacteria bacterium]